eukprot:PhF_6_TR38114/c0_g1_i1/m.56885/K06994/K06994; putative drug exporter of the RND superfamily
MVLHFSNKLAVRYTKFIFNAKYAIILFWVAAIGGCIYPSNLINSRLEQDMLPPANSQAAEAKKLFASKFQEAATSTALVVFSRSSNATPIIPSEGMPWRQDFLRFDAELSNITKSYSADVLAYSSFWSVMDAGLPGPVALQYMSKANTSAMSGVGFRHGPYDSRTKDFTKFLENVTKVLSEKYLNDIDVDVIGITTITNAVADSSSNDVTRMMAFIPIAFVVFSWHLSSLRFLFFPLFITFGSLVITYAIMYGISHSMGINSLMPAVVMCLVVAIVLDYCIFILNTFKHEVRSRLRFTAVLRKEHVEDVVRIVIAKAGYHISVSALALAISCSGLAFFPLSMLQSIGIGCLFGVLTSLLMCLTFVPAMLLACPNFFTFAVRPCCEEGPGNRLSVRMSLGFVDEDEPLPLLAPTRRVDRKTWYFKVGLAITTFPINVSILILVILAFIYPSVKSFNTVYGNAAELYLPRGSSQLAAWSHMYKDFGAGELYDYRLVIAFPEGQNVFDQSAWDIAQAVARDLSRIPNTKCTNVNAASYDGTQGCKYVSQQDILGSMGFCVANPTLCTPQQKYNAVLGVLFIPRASDSTWIIIKLSFDPTSNMGHDWYLAVKDRLPDYESKFGVKVGITGFGADTLDSIDFVTENFKWMVLISSIVVFLLVASAFLSVVIPLRCVLTISMTLMVVYGLAEMVYIEGALNVLNFDGLKKTGMLSWMAPFSALMICIGLSLDYDSYLVTKILEHVLSGKDHRDAVVMGLSDSGRTITVCGLLVCLCFGGLLFSDLPVMNQIAFYVITTSLVDIFVMRLLFVPAIMGVLGEWNWFPMFSFVKAYQREEAQFFPAPPSSTGGNQVTPQAADSSSTPMKTES